MCFIFRTDLQTRSALHWSAMNGHTEVVKMLLTSGAEPDIKDKVYGYTPLMLAARQGHAEIVQCLLDKQCDPNQVDIHSETAVFDAVRNGNVNCAKLLLNAGASFDKVDHYGRTLLLTAVLWNRVSIVALLVKLNCRINVAGVLQYTSSLLLGCDLNTKNMFTPIEAALIENKQDICRILYAAGADASFLFKYAYDISFRECIHITTRKPEYDDISWLNELIQEPRSLKALSRNVIRAFCSSHLSIKQLPLPVSLKDYLNVPEIDIFLQ